MALGSFMLTFFFSNTYTNCCKINFLLR